MWSDMVQYVITGAVPYFVYAALLFGVAKIINMLHKVSDKSSDTSGTSCGADEEPGDLTESVEEHKPEAPEDKNAEQKTEGQEVQKEDVRQTETQEAELLQSEDRKTDEITVSEDAVEETKTIDDGESEDEEASSQEQKAENRSEEK